MTLRLSPSPVSPPPAPRAPTHRQTLETKELQQVAEAIPPGAMADMFIGLHMQVILLEPPGYQVTGTVRDVEAGSSLTLTNGKLPRNRCEGLAV